MVFKSGFVALVGSPNVGKSSLINSIVGEKVAIATPKPQTTRGKIIGIYNEEDVQIVFLDTPGLHESKNKLGDYMNKAAHKAMEGVDVLIVVFDDGFSPAKLKAKEEIIKRADCPVFALVNKTDIIPIARFATINKTLEESGLFYRILGVSALKKQGLDFLLKEIKALLKEGPKYYEDDMYIDANLRTMVEEIVREKILFYMDDEIPHGTAVVVEEFKYREDKPLVDISVLIVCEKESHKGMLIGKKAHKIKGIGMEARKEIEPLVDRKINLKLNVKVVENWRDKISQVKDMGYDIKSL